MLFAPTDIATQKKEAQSSVFLSSTPSTVQFLGSADELERCVMALQEGQTAHWASHGKWSMHDMVRMMLQKAGRSDVFISTWTITETPMRKLFLLKQQGLIASLNCVLDYKIKSRKAGPMQLLNGMADRLALAHCHAKATVVVGQEIALCCVGSANFSLNPRIEAGFISADRNIGNFHRQWIEKVIEDAK